MGSTNSGEGSITDLPFGLDSDRTRTGLEASGASDQVTDPVTDDQRLAAYAVVLADGVQQALPGWVAAAVASRLGGSLPEDLVARVTAAGEAAAADVGGRVRELLALDIDEQWTNPLTLIRTAIRFPTEILQAVDAPPVARDEQSRRFHPDDIYDLTPGSFADLGSAVHDAGLSWGAAKAHVYLRRRREEEVA